MRVYRVKVEVNNYQWIVPDVPDADTLNYVFDCTPRWGNWQQPDVYRFNPLKARGDFLKFGTGALLAGAEAAEAVRPFWEMAGELLPLSCDGDEYVVLNVLECLNALDAKKIEQTTDKWITKFSFHKNRFSESSIFKIPETRAIDVLTLERNGDPESEFKACVEANGFTGLIFEELWDSDD